MYAINLPVAYEREKYSGYNLWCGGGNKANLHGINKALEEGYEYFCLLNHDDFFLPNHLALLSECIERAKINFVTTKCGKFPDIVPTGYYTNYRPQAEHLFLVTACMNLKHFNILPRNVLEETGKAYPTDADLWIRIRKFMEERNEYGIFINEETCERTPEGVTVKKSNIVKFEPTQKSLDIVNNIAKEIVTPHHLHFHILYDLAQTFDGEVNYLEIGCYKGRSACLILQRPNTNVISIDLGHPIPKEEAVANINKFNIHNNSYEYIEASSQSEFTLDLIREKLKDKKLDILFIDGSHHFNDVVNDFKLYSPLVKSNGYIVFDDYEDFKYSPEVRKAVDYLRENQWFKEYIIVGCMSNNLKAYPEEYKINNCYILKKK